MQNTGASIHELVRHFLIHALIARHIDAGKTATSLMLDLPHLEQEVRTHERLIQGYIECALWSSSDDKGRGDPLGKTASDLHPVAVEQMVRDCVQFYSMAERALERANLPLSNAGHDFWLTRNRHGAGFWDRSLGAVGKTLTEFSHAFPEQSLYVGDDNLVYLSND